MPEPDNWDQITEAGVVELTRATGLHISPERLLAFTSQVRALGTIIADLATVDCAGITSTSIFEPRDAWRPTATTQVDGR